MDSKFIKEEVISNIRCHLGEGCQISTCNRYYAWVDITTKKIFLYDVQQKKTKLYKLNSIPSAILKLTDSFAYILDDIGVLKLILKNGLAERIKIFQEYSNNKELRANDGVMVGNNIYWGTMNHQPSHKTGSIFSLVNEELKEIDKVGIPNTFIPLKDKILISDSYEQKTYIYDIKMETKSIWHDFSNTNMVPDGGCMGLNQHIYICLWGAGAIGEFTLSGEIIKVHNMSCKNPTNCIFTSDNKLLVTSANQDNKKNVRKKHINCGKTFILS